MADPPVNPYAVTVAEEPSDPVRLDFDTVSDGSRFDPDLVGTAGLFLGAIGATTAAGSIFGGGVCVVMLVAALLSNGSEAIGFIVIGGFLSIFFSGLFAMLASFPASMILYFLTSPMRRPGGRWSPTTIRLMYGGTGFFSGCLSFFVLSSFDLLGLGLGLVPGLVGGVVAGLAGERKIRRAVEVQRRLRSPGPAASRPTADPIAIPPGRTRRMP